MMNTSTTWTRSREKKPFKPNSDWEFISFKRLIKNEWAAHLKEPEAK
jgi:hypothetical protein